jgi:hypothetical protein
MFSLEKLCISRESPVLELGSDTRFHIMKKIWTKELSNMNPRFEVR